MAKSRHYFTIKLNYEPLRKLNLYYSGQKQHRITFHHTWQIGQKTQTEKVKDNSLLEWAETLYKPEYFSNNNNEFQIVYSALCLGKRTYAIFQTTVKITNLYWLVR